MPPPLRASALTKEGYAVGDGKAQEEIGDGGHGKIDQDLAQRVDLVFVADGARFEKGKAAVHGKHQHCADEEEEHVGARLQAY